MAYKYKGPLRSAKQEFENIKKYRKKLRKLKAANTVFAFTDQQFLLREELRPVRIQLELLKPELILSDHKIQNAAVFFGSSRIPTYTKAKKQFEIAEKKVKLKPQDPEAQKNFKRAKLILENSGYLKEATKLAHMVSTTSLMDFVVFSGGGPSFMRAANKGAFEANKPSVALNILSPLEQVPNEFASPELTFQFHYFSIRKMHFLIRAKVIVAFPGGYGTLDEVFEVLTLLQTKKIEKIPLLLFNKRYWDRIINFAGLVDEGTISEEDLNYITFVETAEEAWSIIKNFYHLKK